ncbi:SDR family NAD(P)-dependent oxidoreductase [Antrihabitans stalactiti]|uniref:SDR family NAD(P)-dependent oxidoreductase n=1 Tax=Antrihabitans stalactiti TaxID=2584121 RepID=A0A848KQD7_9NOCA|nr:SDR family NAD(P)-dependent oxidoreductase [Antrihabitans stalactiti]NMN98812.1 SDR family NAD(P)-dependent oxidoreductase [Antrihabitans stalactiti]
MAGTERSITDERIVVTGGTNGIGKEIARALAQRGAALTLVARNVAKAADVRAELEAEPGARSGIDVVQGDLGDLASVRAAADEINARYDHIDVLVNNAGIHSTGSQITVDGFDHMMATNHLGPFLLTNLLLDRLKAAPAARIVVTASDASRIAGRVDLDRLAEATHYGSVGAEFRYTESKLVNILFTQELARRLAGTKVTANSFCPGMIDTPLARESLSVNAALTLMSAVGIANTPEKGAKWGIRLVVKPEFATTSGRHFSTTKLLGRLPAMPAAKDLDYQRRLWERSAQLVGL